MIARNLKVCVLVAGCLVGCSNRIVPGESDRVSVVATTSVLCDLSEQIAGDLFEIACLLEPGQDPHAFSPTPGDRAAIADADLILFGGYQLAPKIEQLIQKSTTPAPKLPIYELAVPAPLRPKAIASDVKTADEQSESALHHHDVETGAADPHVWHDASHGAAIARVIADALINVAPEQSDTVRERTDTLVAELSAIHVWIEDRVATIPTEQRKLITTHAAFGYFADAYGLEVAGALSGLSNAEQPSAQRLAALVDWIETSGVTAIFAESSTNRDLIDTLARNAGAIVPEQALFVEGPAGEGTSAVTYQDMLIGNTCTIVEGLGGTCHETFSPSISE